MCSYFLSFTNHFTLAIQKLSELIFFTSELKYAGKKSAFYHLSSLLIEIIFINNVFNKLFFLSALQVQNFVSDNWEKKTRNQ